MPLCPRLLLRAHHDAATTATSSAPLGTTPFAALGCHWKLDTTFVGSGRHALRLTLLSGDCPPVSAGLMLDLSDWSTEVYTLLPGALYAGNRFGSRPQNYSPRYPQADARPDAPTLVTDLPRLALAPGAPSRVSLLTGDLAAPVFAARWPDGTTVLVTAPEAPADALWELAESADRSSATFALMIPAVRETRYSFRGPIRTDAPSGDRGRVLAPGESLELRFQLHTFTTPDLAALFEHLLDHHAASMEAVPLRHELPLSAAFDLIEAKRNREDWSADLGIYRTTNLNPGQTTNVFQTGWCGGIIAESALLVGTPDSAERARRSLDTIATRAPRSTGWFAGKCHADGSWTADFVHDAQRPYTHDWTLVRRQADALFYLLAAADRHTARTSTPAPAAWTDAARGLADAFTNLCDRHLAPGHFIDIDTGAIRVGNSASGALAPAALCAAAKRFNRPEYLHTAAALGAYYHEHYTTKGFSTGGPADAMQAPDSESSAGLVESFLALHEADAPGGPWLDRARDAAAQLASWVMPYDYAFPADSEFGRLGMPTVGSVFANAQNKHAAPGLCTHSGLSLFRLFRHTGDIRLLRLVAAIARFLPWCVSRTDRPIHAHEQRALPSGWINERVNTSDWDHNLGGVFHGSTWSEVALLLTAVELPSVYAQPDTGLLVSLDHLEAEWTDAARTAVQISNPTRFPARVRLFAETKADASARVFGPAAAGALPVHAVAAGASLELQVAHAGSVQPSARGPEREFREFAPRTARPPGAPVRILRVGDSITRMAAADPTFARRLAEADVDHVFVGGQHPRGEHAELNSACEGYDGKPIEFFLTHQASYGQERVFADAVPLHRALETEHPDLVLAMLGVNNLGNSHAAEIDIAHLTRLLREFIDRTEQWMPKGALILVATVPPANDAHGKEGPALNRNLRHALYNDQVVRPLVAGLAAAGRPVRLVDHHAALTPADNYDVVHQNETGRVKINTVWADAVIATLSTAAKAW